MAARITRDRLVVAGAALAVLGVVGAPGVAYRIAGGTGPVPPPDAALSAPARRALDLPGASLSQGRVLVPVRPDQQLPGLDRDDLVDPDTFAAEPVPLGVAGLVPLGPDLVGPGDAGWVVRLTPGDRVLADLGPLSAACLTHRNDTGCTPLLVTFHDGAYYRFPVGLGGTDLLEPGSGLQAQALATVDGVLYLGGLPGRQVGTVTLRLADGRRLAASTSSDVAPGGTLWWAPADEPVEAILARSQDGAVLGEITGPDLPALPPG